MNLNTRIYSPPCVIEFFDLENRFILYTFVKVAKVKLVRIMRRIFLFLCLGLLLVGCVKENPHTIFPVDKQDVVMTMDGGELTINFDIPPSMRTDVDVIIQQLNGRSEWIKLQSYNATSATFTVERNLQPFERNAIIRIKTKSFPDYATINVMQECFDPDFFQIEVNDITTSSFDATITAKDENMCIVGFVLQLNGKSTIEERPYDYLIEDGSLIYLNFVDSYVLHANANGLDLKEFMIEQGVCGQGSLSKRNYPMEPGGQYCLFVAGVEFGETASGGQYLDVVTTATNLYFEIESTPIREDILLEATVELDPAYGSDVLLSINCDDSSNLQYRYMIYTPEKHDPYIFEEHTLDEFYDYYSHLWYQEYCNSLAYGIENLEAFLEESTFADSFANERLRLEANTEYCLVAYAIDVVDTSIQVVSYPEIVRFTTGECAMSDISFEMTTNKLHSRMVDFTITPSDDLDGYYTTIMSKQEYDSWDKTLLHQRLVDEGWANGGVCYGANDFEFRFLNPITDYYVLCVGVHGGTATTEDITLFPITTPVQAESKCRVTGVDCYGPFYAGALDAYNHDKYHMNGKWFQYDMNDYCAVGIDIHTEGEVYKLFSLFLPDEDTVGYGKNQIVPMLKDSDCMPKIYFYCKHNVPFHFYVAAMDEDGNIDLYTSPDGYNFTRENHITDEASIAELATFYDEVQAQYEDTRAAIQPATRAAQSDAPCLPVVY